MLTAALTLLPASLGPAAASAAARRPPPRTARSELARMYREGVIPQSAYRAYTASVNAALAAVRQLRGTRAAELAAVLANLHDIAVRRQLTPSRLPVLFLTLDRNRQWWTSNPLLAAGQRVSFPGSQLVWEYYPGQGIELQELGSWGQVDWMYHAGPRYWPRMLSLVNELIPLAADRGGGIAWEYYFSFDGGTPPWTSAMSQATALQALTESYEATKDATYLMLAARALPIFHAPPPIGVAVPTERGMRYLLYSFAPTAAVINGFLQTLIGLYDYAQVSGDADAQALFAAGDAEAQYELPGYDTDAWSLYQPGEESSLDYHMLVTQFLDQLCSRTKAAIYCTTAQHFHSYLKTPPTLSLLTQTVKAQRGGLVRFRVSKVGRVGITIQSGTRTLFLTSADFSYGVHAFAIPALNPGSYTVTLDSTDLAGNYSEASFSLTAVAGAQKHS